MKRGLRAAISLLSLGVALLAGACVNTVRFPPDLWVDETDFSTFTDDGSFGFDSDTGGSPPPEPPPVPEVAINLAWGTCGADGQTVEVITTGWASAIVLDILHADGRSETHPLTRTATDPNGNWDQWAVQLAAGETQFACDDEAEFLTYALRLRTSDLALSDCGIWGVNLNQMDLWLEVNEPAYTGFCRVLEF